MPPRSVLRRIAAPSSQSLPSALVSPQADTFWQAAGDTEAYNAPMGNAIADISEGTVVKESAQYIDFFNDRWIATVDADGETAWLRELEELSLDGDEEDRDAEWVVTEQADAPTAPAAPSPAQSLRRELLPAVPSLEEVALFEHYWASVYVEGEHRDWNTEYHRASENILFGVSTSEGDGAMDDARVALQGIVQEFAAHVESGVTTIVTEMFGSSKARGAATRHPSNAGVFYLNGTIFQIAIDGSGSLGGDDAAMKVSSQVSKNIQTVAHVAPRYLLAVPMALSMTFGGYQVLATSIPPIGPTASRLQVTEGSLLGELIEGLGSELNLKTGSFSGSIGLSPLFTVVAGHDCRLYLFGLSDIMPPLAPPSRRTTFAPNVTSRFWRLRKEAVEQAAAPLSAASFIKGCSDDADNSAALRMTHWVRCVGLQTSAAVLGLMERCSVPGMERIVCSGCHKEVEDELRFGVCEGGCCYICAQCNINAYELMTVKKDSRECSRLLKSFVQCRSRPLTIRSLRLSPDVSSILHHHGVNLRFLHAVYALLPSSSRGIMGYHLEIEMVARAAKVVLNRKLRRGTTSLQDIGNISASFFMTLMQPSGEQAEAFWAQELGPAIQERFDVFVPFDTEALDIVRVCARVSELTGVVLTDESVESFARLQRGVVTDEDSEGGEVGDDGKPKHVPTPPRKRKDEAVGDEAQKPSAGPADKKDPRADSRPYVQISNISPTMKDFSVPIYCNAVGDRRSFLKERLSALLLLWAGEMDGCREQFMLFEACHPQYLIEEGNN